MSERYHLCRTTGKQGHTDRARAQRHLASLGRNFHYRGETYRCRFCGLWHVGHLHGVRKGHDERRGVSSEEAR